MGALETTMRLEVERERLDSARGIKSKMQDAFDISENFFARGCSLFLRRAHYQSGIIESAQFVFG